MSGYRTRLPPTGGRLRREIHHGALFHTGANAASLALVDEAWGLLTRHLGPGDPRHAQARLEDADFFERVGRVRKVLFEDRHFHRLVFDVIERAGLDPATVAFDPARLRVVSSGGHTNPRAAPLYYAHRDTWFCISPSAIAWWVALHDVPDSETFEIYPEWLDRAVENDSDGFHLEPFASDARELRIGWQDRDAGQTVHYSQAISDFDPGLQVRLPALRGDNVLFSAAHLHRTLPHDAGYTRFSLDFRVVHLGDHKAGRGAPNVDNHSTGDATPSYVRR